ncbi:PREDICTED: DAZ-associated protein 2-like isoform X2 [Priapulus caudatus]|uniref:DAZ-associated protein 2 n=1 Tax=Priapulus caudatus TaxID=37621 RepID=A0ABM1DR81_PRICU|nr:PREDICTED: DAZ-associated protein 2-like isoform X2 [Priapulus caudatus]XP_014662453.1 PREDICTED: DAZ-associated protein 2-like isoform X2 [Priapulus caudatus]XP_014662454.1 PREDICTED: DAZ-associated protein 2-like isoform X2 [Priapulus caudatus]
MGCCLSSKDPVASAPLPPSYPAGQQGYPTAPAYPSQAGALGYAPQPGAAGYPTLSGDKGYAPQPGAPGYAPQPGAYDAPPPYAPYAPAAAPAPAPQVIIAQQATYDAGARFDVAAQPNIPPPPPGVMPNTAQLAAMQGQGAVIVQKPGNFWTGGSSGGTTFW